MQSSPTTNSCDESSSSSHLTNNNKDAKQPFACPYAVALHGNNPDDETRQDSTIKDTTTTSSAGNGASRPEPRASIASCPAFQSGSCPFKDAKSAQEVRQKLLQVPPSHLEQSGEFYKVIQQMHANMSAKDETSFTTTNTTTTTTPFHLPGGCPVQSVVGSDMPTISFTQALESMSLSSIMARMATKVLEEEGHTAGDQEDESSESEAHDNEPKIVVTEIASAAIAEAPPGQQEQQQQHTVSLSESLKTGTAVSHQDAENVHFVKNFAHGKIDRYLYGQLVIQLYHVYATLEKLLNEHAPEHFPSCHFPLELSRTAALEEDLDYWHGSSNRSSTTVKPPISPATADYMQRLHDIAQTDPILLLAHSYTRYLGDLSGGRILARVARKAMNLGQGGEGLAFYDFGNIKSPKKFKDRFRQSLDALPLDGSSLPSNNVLGRLVAEANVAFCLNMRLFEELDVLANVPGASVRPLQEALKYTDMTLSTTETSKNKKEECPFLVQKQQEHVADNSSSTVVNTKRCPWPFIFAHDPTQGMRDWQTWVVMGLILCWIWSVVLRQQQPIITAELQ